MLSTTAILMISRVSSGALWKGFDQVKRREGLFIGDEVGVSICHGLHALGTPRDGGFRDGSLLVDDESTVLGGYAAGPLQ